MYLNVSDATISRDIGYCLVYIQHEYLKIVLCHMNFRFHCFQCFDLFHISKKYRHIMFKLIQILEEFCDYLLLPIRKVNICHNRNIIRMLQKFMSEKKSTDCRFLLKFFKNTLNSCRKSSRLCLLLSSRFKKNRLSFILISNRNNEIKTNLDLRLVTKEWFVDSKYLRSFTNYIDKILSFFDHLPTLTFSTL